MLEVFDEQTVGVAQSRPTSNSRREGIPDQFGAQGEARLDGSIEMSEDHRDSRVPGLLGTVALSRIQVDDEEGADGGRADPEFTRIEVHVQRGPRQSLVAAHGLLEVPRLGQDLRQHAGLRER